MIIAQVRAVVESSHNPPGPAHIVAKLGPGSGAGGRRANSYIERIKASIIAADVQLPTRQQG